MVGTNPSLLETLGSTDLNLLLDAGFNREVAENIALYWSKNVGTLAALIERADALSFNKIAAYGEKSSARIAQAYSWKFICGRSAEEVFLG